MIRNNLSTRQLVNLVMIRNNLSTGQLVNLLTLWKHGTRIVGHGTNQQQRALGACDVVVATTEAAEHPQQQGTEGHRAEVPQADAAQLKRGNRGGESQYHEDIEDVKKK